MTDYEMDCAEAIELVSEMAIGVASADDRARLLGHLATCSDCSTLLGDLSTVVDDIVALAPDHEPPGGFESEVLTRLADNRRGAVDQPMHTPGWPTRWRGFALRAAVLAFVAGVAAGVVYQGHASDRSLADRVRATLATSNGQYFAAAPLVDADGQRGGVLFAYQGEPSWMFLTLKRNVLPRPVTVELVAYDGTIYTIGEDVDLGPEKPWGTIIPIAVHEAGLVNVLDADGTAVVSARLTPP